MATITSRKGYRVLNFTDPETDKRRHVSLAKVGVLSAKQERDILIAKEFELSTGAKLLNVHRRPAPRFQDFARDYLIWHRLEYPDSHYRVAQILHDHLIPEFGLTPLNLLTVEKAEAYKTRRRFQVRGSTVTKEFRVFHAVINRAVLLKKLAENPIAIVQGPQNLDSKPHHWYEDQDDLVRLYRVSSYWPVWKLLANTGLRRGEAGHMRRLWVTDAVRIQSTGEERTKAGEWRKIPLTDGAREALAALQGDGPYLLPRICPESLSRAYARDARKARIGGSLHSLRHTYICRLLLQPGISIRTVQLYAGHASITTTEKYAYQVLKNDPPAVAGLNI
jgi:integrase